MDFDVAKKQLQINELKELVKETQRNITKLEFCLLNISDLEEHYKNDPIKNLKECKKAYMQNVALYNIRKKSVDDLGLELDVVLKGFDVESSKLYNDTPNLLHKHSEEQLMEKIKNSMKTIPYLFRFNQAKHKEELKQRSEELELENASLTNKDNVDNLIKDNKEVKEQQCSEPVKPTSKNHNKLYELFNKAQQKKDI